MFTTSPGARSGMIIHQYSGFEEGAQLDNTATEGDGHHAEHGKLDQFSGNERRRFRLLRMTGVHISDNGH
jgi:hypothetical protein